ELALPELAGELRCGRIRRQRGGRGARDSGGEDQARSSAREVVLEEPWRGEILDVVVAARAFLLVEEVPVPQRIDAEGTARACDHGGERAIRLPADGADFDPAREH